MIRNKSMKVTEAARHFNICRRTLHYKMKQMNSSTGTNRKLGRPTIFSKKEEEAFSQHLLLLSEFTMPITTDDLRIVVQIYLQKSRRVVHCFKNNVPGRDWIRNFQRRHPILSARFAENVKVARAAVSEEMLRA